MGPARGSPPPHRGRWQELCATPSSASPPSRTAQRPSPSTASTQFQHQLKLPGGWLPLQGCDERPSRCCPPSCPNKCHRLDNVWMIFQTFKTLNILNSLKINIIY